jgi:hypothetical protein
LVWAEAHEEVYTWVLARMAALRSAVAVLVVELADRAPAECAVVEQAWRSGKG